MARVRDGLSSRSHGVPDQVQIHIHDKGFDFDSEVESMRASVRGIRQLAQGIEEERKQQGEIIDALGDALDRARLSLKQTMGRLNRTMKQAQCNHLLMLVIFAIFLFLIIYVVAKVYKLGRHILG